MPIRYVFPPESSSHGLAGSTPFSTWNINPLYLMLCRPVSFKAARFQYIACKLKQKYAVSPARHVTAICRSKGVCCLARFYSSDAELARLFKSINGLILPVSLYCQESFPTSGCPESYMTTGLSPRHWLHALLGIFGPESIWLLVTAHYTVPSFLHWLCTTCQRSSIFLSLALHHRWVCVLWMLTSKCACRVD